MRSSGGAVLQSEIIKKYMFYLTASQTVGWGWGSIFYCKGEWETTLRWVIKLVLLNYHIEEGSKLERRMRDAWNELIRMLDCETVLLIWIDNKFERYKYKPRLILTDILYVTSIGELTEASN